MAYERKIKRYPSFKAGLSEKLRELEEINY
jgi:hypothetical protein